MKCVNEMTIVFESRSANEGFARAAAAAFFLPLDPTVEELSDLKTALSEAVTNAIVHGYPHQIGKINFIQFLRTTSGILSNFAHPYSFLLPFA